MRHHDYMIWEIDANLDLGSNCDGSLRSVHAHSLLHDLGLYVSQNRGITWQNHNACTYIDFVLYRGLSVEELKGHTDWNAAEFVQSDQCAAATLLVFYVHVQVQRLPNVSRNLQSATARGTKGRVQT